MDYIRKDDVLELLNKNSITKIITLVDGISIYDSVKNLRAADAVPSEELELWKNERFNYYQRLQCYGMTRKMVAREVFEEIQKIFAHRILYNESQYFEGALDNITKDLDKLKKKFTEGE